MVNKREGYTKVCCDIPTEWHNKITEFNKTANRPINMSNVMRNALKKCVEEIDKK